MSAIHRRFVDRFVGLRVPSRVSRRWVSSHGAPLPSRGSRRARFPAVISTMRTLRLPVRAFPVPYGFGSGLHTLSSVVRARRGAPGAAEGRCQARGLWSAGVPGVRRFAYGHALDLSGFLAFHPMPLPCSQTPAGSAGPRQLRSPRCCSRSQHSESSSRNMISRLTQGLGIRCLRFTTGVAAVHARLASGWRAAPLPGGS